MKPNTHDGQTVAAVLKENGFKIKIVTRSRVVALVTICRKQAIQQVLSLFQDSVYDPDAKGSSLGAVFVGGVKVVVKTDGKDAGLSVESSAIEAVRSALAELNKPITIVMNHRKVEGVVGVEKTPGTPKSDFHLVNTEGKPVAFISHKKGKRARDFQQWGGLTEKQLAEHSLTRLFAAEAKRLYGSAIPAGESACMMPPKNELGKELALMSVYGVDAPKGIPGENCVDLLLQGTPVLKKLSEDEYELVATGNTHVYPEIPGGDFEPVLSVMYKGDRDNFGIKGARFAVYPAKGRTFKRVIEQPAQGT